MKYTTLKVLVVEYIAKIKTYNKIAGISQITRRYIAINGFDGVITMLGVLLGNYVVGAREYKHIIISGSAVCISLMISGAWSVYNSESSERAKEMRDLEMSTLHVLTGTIIARAQKFASIVLAVLNGFTAGISAFIPLIPFLFGKHLQINACYYAGAFLAFLLLIGNGVFLGKTSKRNLFVSILKMVLAGVFCVALGYLLEFID
jgi:predicted membrane protein (TIGR00267 family)